MTKYNLLCKNCGSGDTKEYTKIYDAHVIVECNECKRRTDYNLSYISIFGLLVYTDLKSELLLYNPEEKLTFEIETES